MEMATKSSFAASPTGDRLPFVVPFVTAKDSFSAGAWYAATIRIRGRQVWAVRDHHRDPVAVVYGSHADAEVMASSKTLLLACDKLLNVLRPLAIEGRLTREDMVKVRDAVEVVQRTHMKTSPPTASSVRVQQPNSGSIDLDPAFRTWCAQQYRTATAHGLSPQSWAELRERYLLGER